jgi:gliding motility-associated lipoprotein GldH
MNRILILLTVALSLFFFSCKSDKLYEEYKTIQSSGWEKDSVARFNVTIDKHYLSYNLSINVRNRGDYPYSNLWLFVDITAPDHTKISDTIEYQLALPNGKWIGKGTGGIYSTQFPFRENVTFPTPGNYTISVRHAMRTNPLTGISDIGLAVKKQ